MKKWGKRRRVERLLRNQIQEGLNEYKRSLRTSQTWADSSAPPPPQFNPTPGCVSVYFDHVTRQGFVAYGVRDLQIGSLFRQCLFEVKKKEALFPYALQALAVLHRMKQHRQRSRYN